MTLQFLALPLLFFAVFKVTPADADVKSETALLHRALTVAGSIGDTESRIETLQEIADAYGAWGEKTEAIAVWNELLKMAGKIENVEHRDALLTDISQGYASAENFPAAIETAGLIIAPYWQALAFIHVAKQSAATGQVAEALQLLAKASEITERIGSGIWRDLALAHAAEAYAKAGKRSMADNLLQQISVSAADDSKAQLIMLHQVMIRYNAIGEWEQALKILSETQIAAPEKMRLARLVATTDVNSGQLEALLAIIQQTNTPRKEDVSKLLAMIEIAHEYISRDEIEKASQILSAAGERAKRPIKDKKYSGYLAKVLIAIAHEYERMKNPIRATYYLSHAMKKISGGHTDRQIELLVSAATTYAELGRTSQAQELVKKLDTVYGETKARFEKNDRALRKNPKGIQQVSSLLKTANIIRKIEDLHYTLKVLGAIGRKYAEDGREEAAASVLAKAVKTVTLEDDARLKASKLIQLSREYARVGQAPTPADLAYIDNIILPAPIAN